MNLFKIAALAMASLITMNLQAAPTPDASHTSGAAPAAGTPPIFNIFELGIQPGQIADYDRVGTHNITTSVGHEPGTLAMYSRQMTVHIRMTLWLRAARKDGPDAGSFVVPPLRA